MDGSARPMARPIARTGRPLAVWSLSLGCPKNRVDSERLLGSLGVPVRPVRHLGRSRLVFINTCGFIEPAVRESIRAILDAARHIARLRGAARPLLAVAGCMVGRYGAPELARELPEVDLWLPTDAMRDWPVLIRRALGLDPGASEAVAAPDAVAGAVAGEGPACATAGRLLSTGPSYAWLKIGEGCRHRCAFCTIPSIRGPLRSEPLAALTAEASRLLAQGVRELALVAQDVSAWGCDAGPGSARLPDLVEALARLDGLTWLRLLYLYPTGVTSELLERMRALGDGRGPVLPYFDIPLQHADRDMLARMGRPFAGDPRRVLDRVRAVFPGAAIRTTMIVGYPGESEAAFERLCRFVEEARFSHLGVFAYQAEDGTRAAALPGQIPVAVREARRATLMELQARISADWLKTFVHSRLPVLVDAPSDEWPGLHRGRAWFQAPEVDGVTWVSGPGVRPGALVDCDVVDSAVYDLNALA